MCPSANVGFVLGMLLSAWVCVLVLLGLAQRSSTSSSLRIAMFFWQVSFLMVGNASWVRWAAFLDLNFLAGSGSGSVCPFPVSPYGMLILQLVGPLFSWVLLAATAAAHRGLAVKPVRLGGAAGAPSRHMRLCEHVPPFEMAAYWRTCITLYFFTFNSITRSGLEFFSCATLPMGTFLVALPAVRCDEHEYRSLRPLVIVLLVAYTVVVPGYIAYRLRVAYLQTGLDASSTARVWSVVYGSLRRTVFWWGLGQMLVRAALVAAVVYLRAADRARYTAFAFLTGSSVAALLVARPNRSTSDNTWELITLSSLSILALSENASAPDAWLATVTLGVGLAIVVRLAAQTARHLARLRKAAVTPSAAEELSSSHARHLRRKPGRHVPLCRSRAPLGIRRKPCQFRNGTNWLRGYSRSRRLSSRLLMLGQPSCSSVGFQDDGAWEFPGNGVHSRAGV